MAKPRHILVTGGNGYIGHRVVSLSLQQGCKVTLLGRSQPADFKNAKVQWFPWDLMSDVNPDAFSPSGPFGPVDAVIHAAHKWDSKFDELIDENVIGTQALLEASRRANVNRFIFCSSVAARAEALNCYGRVKAQIASRLTNTGEIAARIGLVYGGPETGQWGVLCKLVQATPVLPMIAAGTGVQPIHLDEVCQGILALAGKEKINSNSYGLASPQVISFRDFLKTLARERFGKSIWILPVPATVVLWGFSLLNAIPFLPNANKERVLGLAGLPTIETKADMEELGVMVRPLADALCEEAPRRRLLLEGFILLRYLTGGKPGIAMLRRYVHGLHRFGSGRPLRLPFPIKYFPSVLSVLQPLSDDGKGGSELSRRLQMSLLIADAVKHDGQSAYDYVGDGKVLSLLRLTYALGCEVILFPFRILFGRFHS